MKHTLSKIASSLGFIAITAAFNVAQAESLVGINSQNQIGVFDSTNVAAAAFVNITGLSAGESLIGIDLRPSNNLLYGVSNASNLYTVDAYTGAASFVAALSGYAINASLGYGVDFNPVADSNPAAASLRLVSSAGDNLAVNATTGVVGNQANTIAAGNSAVAYANSDPSMIAAATQLYYLNSTTDELFVANSAFNTPTISLIGAIGLDILKANGFELFSNGNAFAAVNTDDGGLNSQLLSINLSTGAGTLLGTFNGTLNGLSAAPSAVPVPAAAWLFGSAILGFAGFRRKAV